MDRVIATEPFVVVNADGHSFDGCVVIGAPAMGDDGVARCAVQLDGVDPMPYVIAGDTTLQALLLAVRMAATLLRALVADHGMRIVNSDGSPWEPDIVFAGLDVTDADRVTP